MSPKLLFANKTKELLNKTKYIEFEEIHFYIHMTNSILYIFKCLQVLKMSSKFQNSESKNPVSSWKHEVKNQDISNILTK